MDRQADDRGILAGRRILVTGGTGIVGRRTVPALMRAGADVVSVSHSRPQRETVASSGSFRGITLDLRAERLAPAELADVTDCIHLAATLFPISSATFFHDNIVITKNVVASLARGASRLNRFVHVSSLAARGPGHSSDYDDPYLDAAAVSSYGESKYASESVARSLLPDRAGLTILRPGIVLSPDDHRLVLTAKNLRLTPGFVLERLPEAISAIEVDDLVSAIIAAITTEPAPTGVFEICHPKPVRVHDIAKRSRRVDSRFPVKVGWPMSAMAAVSSAAAYILRTSPLLTQDKLREMQHVSWCADSSAFTAATGWIPQTDPDTFLKPYVT